MLPTVCPKCHRERKPGEDACARCGLLVARWQGFEPDVPKLEPVDAAWTELEQHWQDDAAHRRFLEQAAAFDGLDVAAALYRKRKREHPDDARADEGLRRTVVFAQEVYAGRTRDQLASASSGIGRAVSIAVVLLVLAASFFLAFTLVRHR